MGRRLRNEISSPDELNSNLVSTKPVTWIVLASVILALAGFFVWSILAKITYKLTGIAHISSNQVTLVIDSNRKSELKVGQKVYISSLEGEILEIKDDGNPIVSTFTLADGDYDYLIILKEMRPIDYFSTR